ETRQPDLVPSSGRVRHHAGPHRPRSHRRLPRARFHPLRHHAALPRRGGRHEGRRHPCRHHGEPAVGPAGIPQESRGHMSGKPYDPAREGAEMSFKGRMSYSDYLRLDRVLDAQQPLSNAHDELLFIIQHQTSELWMKLAIHEIRSAMRAIRSDQLEPAFKMLTRVARIFE